MFQFPVSMFLYDEGYEHTWCVHRESEFRHRIDRNLTFILLEMIVDKIWAPEATSDMSESQKEMHCIGIGV